MPNEPETPLPTPKQVATRLLIVILSLVVNDVEELELVDAFGRGHNAQPVAELHLLEELLSPESPMSATSSRILLACMRVCMCVCVYESVSE